MKKINRLMINICSNKLAETKHFYTKLFDFNVDYDSDWFIHLISEEKALELGIISAKSEVVPTNVSNSIGGFYITFVVANTDEVYDHAKAEGYKIVEAPVDTFYGQRRLVLEDPNGVIVDVSSPMT